MAELGWRCAAGKSRAGVPCQLSRSGPTRADETRAVQWESTNGPSGCRRWKSRSRQGRVTAVVPRGGKNFSRSTIYDRAGRSGVSIRREDSLAEEWAASRWITSSAVDASDDSRSVDVRLPPRSACRAGFNEGGRRWEFRRVGRTTPSWHACSSRTHTIKRTTGGEATARHC